MARKGRRQSLKNSDEWDVVSKFARSILCYLQKSKIKKKIKKMMNKRARQENKRMKEE